MSVVPHRRFPFSSGPPTSSRRQRPSAKVCWSRCSPRGGTARLHLAAATPNFLLCEYPNAFRAGPLANALLTTPIAYAEGHLVVPAGPGLGLTFNEQALAARMLDRYEPVG
ncbi:MAG: mandelate racemase/muconate lactonizing enzyme family protein [Chloroflexi bacterium]|nr:mandelate racemase/muconate lactonizing enzyme family protein [Chloroflexota bacterium]